MRKLALVLGAAIAVVAVASAVTDANRTTQADHARSSMPSIEQLTSKAGDLPEQSWPAF
jgi:hypothetical protein